MFIRLFFRSEAVAMVCFYSVYLLMMYFNPRIEAWLYKITKTKSPEFKSQLHEENGKNGQNPLASEDTEQDDEDDTGGSSDEQQCEQNDSACDDKKRKKKKKKQKKQKKKDKQKTMEPFGKY